MEKEWEDAHQGLAVASLGEREGHMAEFGMAGGGYATLFVDVDPCMYVFLEKRALLFIFLEPQPILNIMC